MSQSATLPCGLQIYFVNRVSKSFGRCAYFKSSKNTFLLRKIDLIVICKFKAHVKVKMSQRVVQGYILTFLQIRYFSRCMGVRTTTLSYTSAKGWRYKPSGTWCIPGLCKKCSYFIQYSHKQSKYYFYMEHSVHDQVPSQGSANGGCQTPVQWRVRVSPCFHDFLSYSSQLKPSERGVRTV